MNNKKIKLIIDTMINKSKQNNYSKFFITAAAYNKKNEFLGIVNNKRNNNKVSKFNCGLHAERELIKRYKGNIKYIVLYRRGNSFNTLPIHPCNTCNKIINKLNIKVIYAYDYLIT